MTSSRVVRGRQTEKMVAEYFRSVHWTAAEATYASLPGDDVKNVGDLAVEVKATAGQLLLPALRQVHARAREDQIPVVVWRPPGYGEARIEEFIVATRLGTFAGPIARRAGYFER